ncbi:UbiH/UbiF/VisC/COQ6 family ubiquinone biosynthesis hydroxylase [Amphritea sp. 1_MG-2023]|uniref:UbiH/UbiF/VisC/COQ6 family ubiquinone biosynthesis hydroxylase n=1 Tax=Amphritea sp. 1_MG-2023 TaxID=3062670 RepID=UPI0026E384D4|nr:UbiH/UbiF/VisC/COQ6 family ubiquinone biosynthesis hydroxylase [Amphritea sp. 1_MG-2023]MDO6562552.1 UbiH/UbiF/VisC/COQ6 family ubiquinone biosynthesis hydroxylase [Amphritea sp. 1_MG-2023]
MKHRYDLLIVGGGMVGATIAAALGHTDLNIAVIDQAYPPPFVAGSEHDLRVSALSVASENIFKTLGVWDGIISRRACPYQRMKVWESDEQRAATEFVSQDIGADHLGFIVENRVIQLALLERLGQLENVDLICPAEIDDIDYSPGCSLIRLADGRELIGKLMVAADGGGSKVRMAAGIGVHSWDYDQHALVASVITAKPQQDITWQQFTPSGPRAFLPLSGHRASLVWYNHPAEVKRLLSLDSEAFIQALVTAFPDRLGALDTLLERGAFPLRRQHALQYVKEGVVLVGDAAHMINPLAGQGVNIGLLDAATLAEVLVDGHHSGLDMSELSLLQRYEQQRRHHNLMMMQLMDSFYRVFSNDVLPLKLLRNIGLGAAERFTPAKHRVMRFAMGLEGQLPALARGEPIGV